MIEQPAEPPRVVTRAIPQQKKRAAESLRVKAHESIPTSTFQVHSKQLKNARFLNKVPHSYQLRPMYKNTGTNFRHLSAQHLSA